MNVRTGTIPGQHERIESWKGIAAFFGRDERTVKRWEKERGLPVRRVPGGERGGVFAYAEELTAWLLGEQAKGAEDSRFAEQGDEQGLAAQSGGRDPLSAPESPSHITGIATEFANSEDADDRQGAGRTGLKPVHAAPETPIAAVAVASEPQPEAASRPVEPPPAPDRRRRRLIAARVAAWLLPLGLTGAFIYYLSGGHAGSRVTAVGDRAPSDAREADLPTDSIAVLPFTNAGGEANSDYLCDGFTESLIGNLAHLPQVKVRSRDAVFRLKGKDLEVQEAGAELGVSEVVSGRVTVMDRNIAISAELTDVRDNTEVWGRQYAGKTSDLIRLQEQIAGDIAEKLRATLSTSEREQVTRQGTQNPEAYTLYLKGRYAWNLRDRAKLEAALSWFNQAIEKDPGYALAYSGLADVYSVLPNFYGNPNEDFPKSNAAARKALELDPTLAHPHAVLGSNEMEYDWDFAAGEAEFRQAIALDPNDATAHQWYAERIGPLGRHQEALAEIRRAHELDPLSPVIARVMAGTLVDAGEYDQAIGICKQLVQENPTFPMAHDCLVYAYWGKRMYADVVEQWKMEGQLTGDPEDLRFADALERGFRSAGWNGALAGAIAVYEARRARGYASPFIIARFYADRGEKDKAFAWLDTAYREHDRLLVNLNVSPGLDNIRSDPRFAELTRKVGLPAAQ